MDQEEQINSDEDYNDEIIQQQHQLEDQLNENNEEEMLSQDNNNSSDIFDNNCIVDKLPTDRRKLQEILGEVKDKIRLYKNLFLHQEYEHTINKSNIDDNSIPICGDITEFNFDEMMKHQMRISGRSFDVVMMDPPWKLSTSQPSRGVAIQYCSLSDETIEKIPVHKLQLEGFLFVWVINAKFQFTVNVMQKWGYKVVDNINWVKKTVNGKIAKGHGFYLQHAKQTCLVGYKGNFKQYEENICCDIIFSDRRGQSQKPTEIYQYIEKLVPNGYYLQIFGRRNNLRKNWVTIGNEL